MNNIEKILWVFARGDTHAQQFESFIYNSSPELESLLGSEFYFELLTLNYKNPRMVSEIRQKLKIWLENNVSRLCNCITWQDHKIIPLGFDTVDLLDGFTILKERTPWLKLMQCQNCGQYWYVAIDTVDDDYYLLRINQHDRVEIIEKDNWPTDFTPKNFT